MSTNMQNKQGEPSLRTAKAARGRNVLVFAGAALAWLCLDMLTKSYFSGNYAENEVITGPLLGLVRFHLVHNTGAAWGMFGDSTFMLGVLSLIVCAALAAYLFVLSPKASLPEALGIALVVAGGLGNALDRFTLGYVVDFIEPVFIDFPIFNIADIGVTCGFVLFLVGLLLRERREALQEKTAMAQGEALERSEASAKEDSCIPDGGESSDEKPVSR